MSKEHECYICHKRLDLYTRWHDDKPICDDCFITLIYPQEIEQRDQQIAELEKALELACDDIRFMSKHLKYNLQSEEFAKKQEQRLKNLENDFKTKAQEKLKR